jgi:DNA helicase II / ATP-dependent DNA helicase PcrA
MIITQSGLLHKLMSHEDQSFLLQVVNTFFDFVKEETAKIRNYSIRDLIKTIEIMEEEKIKLPATRIISNNMGINFVTAHSAKGLEYKHVFIIKANETFLEKSRSGNNDFTLPFTLTKTNSENDIEDDRRLFFVSMTRAIDNLYISHHREDAKGKKLTVSKFVTEIKSPNEESQEVIIEPMVVQSYKMELMRYKRGIASLIDHDLIDRLLLNFKLSVTHLNKYIRCKTAYYFENILRVPLARNASMGFGSVVHYAFEHFFLDINKSNPRSYSSDKKFIAFFEEGMEKYRSHFTSKEFDDYTKYGTKLIKEYYETYQDEFLTPRSYEIEYDIRDVEHRGVPISGKLDRVDIYDDTVKVIDFKTGVTDRAKKIAKPKDTNLDGGEYWRQIIFYRILIDADRRQNWTMRQGVMDFLEKESGKDKLQRQTYDISGEEIQIVSDQLVEAWAGIKAHDFTPGCGEDDCQWCNFVQKHMPVTHLESDNDEMDKE